MNEKFVLLYVDDEEINLKLFEIYYSDKFKILTADSGIKALEILSQNNDIICVISDLKMPEMNGLEFINLAKTLYPKISYFLLTGSSPTEEIVNALSNKLIDKYFSKPFNRIELDSSIEEAIKYQREH